MRLTFVIPESARSYSFLQPPIGVLRSAAIVEEDLGHEFTVVDNRVERLPLEALLRRVDATAPDLLLVTTTTFDQSQVYFLGPRLDRILDTVRALATLAVPLAVCGSHGTVNPDLLLTEVSCDFLLQGEFDVTLAYALPRIEEALGSQAPPLVRSGEPLVLPQPPHSPAEWDEKLPAYHKVRMDRYYGDAIERNVAHRKSHWGVVLGSRGCPYSCEFCYLFLGKRVRYRSVQSVATEIEVLRRRHGVTGFFFLDYTFTLNRRWALDLCAEIQSRDLPDLAWSCQTRADRLDDEVLTALRAAGCADVWLGIESFAEPTLQEADKAIEPETMKDAIVRVREHGMKPIGYIMLGLPGESADTLRTTLTYLRELQLDYLDGIELATPRPGTTLFDRYSDEYPRLGTSWEYVEAVSGLLGNDVTPGMLISAFQWMSHRDAIYTDRPIPEFRATPFDRRCKERILELGRKADR